MARFKLSTGIDLAAKPLPGADPEGILIGTALPKEGTFPH
jgi:hypothetical protein